MKSNALVKSDSSKKELVSLTKTFRQAAKNHNKLVTVAQKHGRAAYEAALECGNLLLQIKETMPYGDFGNWLEKNASGVSTSTWYNYMKLARIPTVGILDEQKRLKKAYLQIGILPDVPRSPRQPSARKESSASAAPTEPRPVLEAEVVSSTSDPAPSLKPAAAPVIATTPVEAQAALKAVQERKAAEQKPAPVIIMGADTVRAWLKTPDGEKFLAQIPKQAAAPSPVAEPSQESSKFVRIPVGPPLTLALLKTALKSLVALIPMTADHEAFGNLISEYAAMELRLARDKGRRPVSPYTR